MLPAAVVTEISGIVGKEFLITDSSELFVYESDGFTIAHARPGAVVFPRTVEQVIAVVKLLASRDIQIIPRGSGTGLTGGCVAYENGVIVSTTKLNKILSIDLENRVAHVEAGVRNVQLSEAVAALSGGSGYHFAPDPSSQRASTVGGNAATNAGGIHTLKDFVSSNHILGMQLILPSGELIEVGAANGCYENTFDLPGLICGTEGTLGIITKLWVRLAPKRTSFRTLVAIFSASDDACRAVSDIIAVGVLPSAMEMMDGAMLKAVEGAFHLGIPADAQAMLLIEIDGIEPLLDDELAELLNICTANRATKIDHTADPVQRAKLWKARKGAFGALGRLSHSYCTQDACVPRSRLSEVLVRIAEIGMKYGLTIPSAFHAGDGNIHPIFLYDDRDESQTQNTLRAAEEVLKYCVDVGGTITGEHGVGVEKIHLMPYLFDQATMDQFERVKAAFDPAQHMNVGKRLPSDKVQVSLLKPARHVPQ
jgi:glycolate oxidase